MLSKQEAAAEIRAAKIRLGLSWAQLTLEHRLAGRPPHVSHQRCPTVGGIKSGNFRI
jgi:hypothetical protein